MKKCVEKVRLIYGDAYERLNHFERLCLVIALLEDYCIILLS